MRDETKLGTCPDRCQSRRRRRRVGGFAARADSTEPSDADRSRRSAVQASPVTLPPPTPSSRSRARALPERLERISRAPTGSGFLRGSTRCARTRAIRADPTPGDNSMFAPATGTRSSSHRHRNPLNPRKRSHRLVTFHGHGLRPGARPGRSRDPRAIVFAALRRT